MSGADRARKRRPEIAPAEDGAVRIPLCRLDGSVRAYAIVDEADAAWLNQWHWSFSKGYAVRVDKNEHGEQHAVLMHRALLGLSRGNKLQGDHINRDPLDNRRANLRVVPRRGNLQNRGKQLGLTSSFRGVHFDARTQQWRAEVKTEERRFRLGRFDTEQDAADAARTVRLREMPYAVD